MVFILGGPPFTRPGLFGGLGGLPGAAPFGGLGKDRMMKIDYEPMEL